MKINRYLNLHPVPYCNQNRTGELWFGQLRPLDVRLAKNHFWKEITPNTSTSKGAGFLINLNTVANSHICTVKNKSKLIHHVFISSWKKYI